MLGELFYAELPVFAPTKFGFALAENRKNSFNENFMSVSAIEIHFSQKSYGMTPKRHGTPL
jgi:hypothetical protein